MPVDWSALGAVLGDRGAKALEARGLFDRGAKLLEGARPFLPADVNRRVERAQALVALGFAPWDEPTRDQITAACAEVVRTCHPDRTDDPAAIARFKAALAAREVLLD